MCCARCPEACSSHLPTSHRALRLPGQPGKRQALADPWAGPCSVTGKWCSLRALCLPGLPQLLQVAWGVGGCVESIGSGAPLAVEMLPLSLWDERCSQCCPCSSRCVVAAGLHTPPTTPITTSPQRCNKTVEVCVELSQTPHCKLRILPAIPTPSSLCGLWYFPSPVLC